MPNQTALSFRSLDDGASTVIIPSGPPLEIIDKGRRWRRADHLLNQKRGSYQSRVWDLGLEYREAEDDNKRAWRCSICAGNSLITLTGVSTSAAVRHLRKKHKISLTQEDEITSQQSSDLASSITEEYDLPVHRSLVHSVNVGKFRYHLLRWVVNSQLAFTAVEDEDFQAMLITLVPSISPYLITGDTVRNWVLDEYLRANEAVKQLLAEAKSRIHISFNLWTSPHQMALCAVIAHFVGPQWRNISVLIGMKRMKGAHGGENIAEVIIPILKEYHISPHLGVFVADNVESNDTAIRAILKAERPDIIGETRRSRCLGHIINLAAKAFLFRKDIEAFEDSLTNVDEDTSVESKAMIAAQEAWREKGPIGKLHNIVVYIRSSPQRREAFKRVISDSQVENLMVTLDNSTRWNSTYKSLKRALQLKDKIQLFCFQQQGALSSDLLTEEDWHYLEEVSQGLKPFHQATMRVEGHAGAGHHGAVWEVLPILEALLQDMERRQTALINQGKGGEPLAVAYQNAWQKLDKYYSLTDTCHEIYAAAILFHPSHRKHYFDRFWTSKTMKQYKASMIATARDKWESQYRGYVTAMDPILKDNQEELDILDRYLAVEEQQQNDQFSAYVNSQGVVFPQGQDIDLINWWINDHSYPQLRQNALDLLSIPAMSAEVERVFSSAKRLVAPDRMRLNDETIEYLELLKYWWSKGIVSQHHR